MITVITGQPGAGKTSLLVYLLTTDKNIQFQKDENGDFKKDENGELVRRPIYVDGIPDLKLDYCRPFPEGHSVEDWQDDWAEHGAVFVIDECQRFFRPRSASSKVPPYIAGLETHRHRGYDFVLITQHPKLIDGNVRFLSGRHLHIRKNVLGFRQMIEWPEVQGEPSSHSAISNGIIKPFKLKKKVFNLYRSATVHTRMTTKISGVWLFLGLALVGFLIAGYFFYDQWFGKVKRAQSEQIASQSVDKTELMTASEPQFFMQHLDQQSIEKKNLGTAPLDYVARIPEKPETKPIYDDLRIPVNMEFPEVCIASADKCTCYSNQATIIEEISEAFCRKYVKKGIFNPYKQKPQENQIAKS